MWLNVKDPENPKFSWIDGNNNYQVSFPESKEKEKIDQIAELKLMLDKYFLECFQMQVETPWIFLHCFTFKNGV